MPKQNSDSISNTDQVGCTCWMCQMLARQMIGVAKLESAIEEIFEPMCEECHVRATVFDQRCQECWDQAEEDRKDDLFESMKGLGYV